eukprot:tig00000147_g9452.t1
MTDDALAAVGDRCPDLHELSLLDMPYFTSGGVARAAGARLQCLRLTRAGDVDDDLLLHLAAHCPDLRTLVLSQTAAPLSHDAVRAVLARCYGLASLSLASCRLAGDLDLGPLPPGLATLSLRHNPRLTALRAFGGALESLDLSFCPALDAASLPPLRAALHRLASLDLSACRLPEEAVLALAVGGNALGDAGVQRLLAIAPRLEELGAAACPRLSSATLVAVRVALAAGAPLSRLHLSPPTSHPARVALKELQASHPGVHVFLEERLMRPRPSAYPS